MFDPKKPSIEHYRFDFDIITTSIRKIFSKRDFDINNFTFHINEALDQLEVFIWKQRVGKQQKKNIDFYVPRTWKDHFKKKHRKKRWMKRWLKKHPIQSRTISFDISKTTIFPKVEVPTKKGEFHEKAIYYEARKK